jgi:hypothetical protein
MVNFKDFLSDSDEETVEGTFDCQICDECVPTAKITEKGTLVWKCSVGHLSLIENFLS